MSCLNLRLIFLIYRYTFEVHLGVVWHDKGLCHFLHLLKLSSDNEIWVESKNKSKKQAEHARRVERDCVGVSVLKCHSVELLVFSRNSAVNQQLPQTKFVFLFSISNSRAISPDWNEILALDRYNLVPQWVCYACFQHQRIHACSLKGLSWFHVTLRGGLFPKCRCHQQS